MSGPRFCLVRRDPKPERKAFQKKKKKTTQNESRSDFVFVNRRYQSPVRGFDLGQATELPGSVQRCLKPLSLIDRKGVIG